MVRRVLCQRDLLAHVRDAVDNVVIRRAIVADKHMAGIVIEQVWHRDGFEWG